jgi:uncharacterized protein involved in type VI secretion and phage assembly
MSADDDGPLSRTDDILARGGEAATRPARAVDYPGLLAEEPRRRGDERKRYFGLYPALVSEVTDPSRSGRIEVELPWLGSDVRVWATLLSPYADQNQGFQALPEVGSRVVVAFEAGDPRLPYIVGACWNFAQRGDEAEVMDGTLPEAQTAANDKRLIKTRSGSTLVFDDAAAGAKVTLATPNGHTLELDDEASEIRITHPNGAVITLTPAGKVEITAAGAVDIRAAAVNVHAASATFDGIVNCTTLIATSGVISPSYTGP